MNVYSLRKTFCAGGFGYIKGFFFKSRLCNRVAMIIKFSFKLCGGNPFIINKVKSSVGQVILYIRTSCYTACRKTEKQVGGQHQLKFAPDHAPWRPW